MSLLRWTSKSSTKLAAERPQELRGVVANGAAPAAQARLLAAGQRQGDQGPPTRRPRAQFRYLNDMAAFIADDQTAISVDTKKKELIGDFANRGTERQRVGEPERV